MVTSLIEEMTDSAPTRSYKMGQNLSFQDPSTFPPNNQYKDMLEKKLKKIYKSKYRGKFNRLLKEHICGTLKAKLIDPIDQYQAFCTLVYEGKEHNIALEKIIYSLYFVLIELESSKIGIHQMEQKFNDQIFNSEESYTELLEKLSANLKNLCELFGSRLEQLLQQFCPRILQFEIQDKFIRHNEWLVRAFNKMTEEISLTLELIEKLKLATNQETKEIFFLELLEFYAAAFQYETENDPLHVANFLAFTRERLRTVNVLLKNNNVEDIVRLAKGPRSDNGQDRFAPWKDCVNWVKERQLDLSQFDPIAPEGDGTEDTINENEYLAFIKTIGGFQHSRDLRINISICKNDRIYPLKLRKILNSVDDQKSSEKVQEALKKAQRSLEKEAEEVLEREKECTILKQDNITKYVHYQSGMVAEYFKQDNSMFLKRVFKVDKAQFLQWAAISCLFSKEHCVGIYEDFVASCKKYFQPASVLFYLKHAQASEWSLKCREYGCECEADLPLCEFDLRNIALRFLEDRPFMRSLSTGAVHLLKHGGRGFAEKMEIHMGDKLDFHCETYFTTASSLLRFKECDAKDTLSWVNAHKDDFKYTFSKSGFLTISYGVWDGRRPGIFAHISISGKGKISMKTLFTGVLTCPDQAKCFGLKKAYAIFVKNGRKLQFE